jgi:hypothetical protein
MPYCYSDIRKKVLDKALEKFLSPNSKTFKRVMEDKVEIISNKGLKTDREQAFEIAGNLVRRVREITHGGVQGYINDHDKYEPVSVTFMVSDKMIKHMLEELNKNPDQLDLFDKNIFGFGIGSVELEQALQSARTSRTKMSLEQMLEEARAQLEKITSSQRKGTNLEREVKKDLHELLKFLRDPEKMGQLKTMSTYFAEIHVLLEHYKNRAIKASEMENPSAKIMELSFLMQMANSFKPFVSQLFSEFADTPDSNRIKSMMKDMISNITTIERTHSQDSLYGVVDALFETTNPVVESLQKELEEEIVYLTKRLEVRKQKGDDKKKQDKLEKKIQDLKDRKTALIPTRDVLLQTLLGNRGDSNFISGMLEATIASGDPIVAGFAKKVKDAFNEIRKRALPFKNDAQTIHEKYSRIMGRDNANNSKYYEGLYEVIEIPTFEKDGKMSFRKVYALVGEYDQSFFNKEAEFKDKIDKLKKEKKLDEAQEVDKEYQNWLATYAERQFTDEWYDAAKLLIPEAKVAQEEILDQINFITKGPNKNNLSEQDLDDLEGWWGAYKALGSLVYPKTGKKKVGKDLEIANSIRAYRKEMNKMRSFQLTEEGRKNFEAARDKQTALLLNNQITQEQYEKWLRRFTSLRISPEFFRKRQAILDRINAFTSKIPESLTGSKENYNQMWELLSSIGNNNRDQDGVIDGSNLNEEEFGAAKDTEIKLEEIKSTLLGFSGLSVAAQKELDALLDTAPEELSEEDNERIQELFESRDWFKSELAKHISEAELKALFSAFKELKKIQKKEPTKYYEDRFNEEYEAYIDLIPGKDELSEIEKRQIFTESSWYKENHITRSTKIEKEDGTFEFQETDEPLYVWTHVIPVDENYIEEGYPSIHFQERVVKEEFKNANYINPRDNGGFHQPKRYVGNHENEYVNPKFREIKVKAGQGDEKAQVQLEMLSFLTRTYLNAQQSIGIPSATRMRLILPSIEKDWLDRFHNSEGQGGVFKQMGDYVKRRFTMTEQDKDTLTGYAGSEGNHQLALADELGIEFKYLPVKYTGKIDIDNVSLNLMDSVMKFHLMAEQYNVLHELEPFKNALLSILKNPQNQVSTGKIDALLNKFGITRMVKQEGQSNRFKQIDEFVRSVFYGENVKEEKWLGKNTVKYVDNLLSMSALQMLALNIPSHTVNVISGEIQSLIESNAKKFFTKRTWLQAKSIYSRNIHNFWQDYQKEGNQSLLTQLSFLYDVPQGEAFDKFGNKTDWSKLREGKGWLFMTKNIGEHEIQITTMVAMLLNKRVKIGDSETTLLDAYELDKKGNLKLKDGVELSEDEFNQLTGRMHSILKDLNGNYNQFDRPLIEKYSLGRMAFFMRKYLVPMVSRRFSTLHVDMEAGTFKEGYYRTFFRVFWNDLKDLELTIGENWKDLTLEEKQAMWRVIMEASIIAMLFVLLLTMGYYDDDRELAIDGEGLDKMDNLKFWKMHLMYLLLRSKSEAENFIPAPYLGANEMYNQATSPSLALRTVSNMLQIMEQVGYLAIGDDKAFYDRNYGVWEKGDWKIWSKAGKLVGFTGNWLNPDLMLRNLENTQRIK